MTLLGIDYGRSKIGIAIAYGPLAEPYGVITLSELKKLKELVESEKVEKIIVGVSEGKMGEESKAFGLKLEKDLNIKVEFQDESLSSIDAQRLSIEAGIRQSKRRNLEDAYAATVMLQNYIDSNTS